MPYEGFAVTLQQINTLAWQILRLANETENVKSGPFKVKEIHKNYTRISCLICYLTL